MRRPWTEQETAELVRLYQCCSVMAIAERLERSPLSVEGAMRRLGLSARAPRPHWPPAEIERLRALVRLHFTCREIAGIMGRSYRSVANQALRSGGAAHPVRPWGRQETYQLLTYAEVGKIAAELLTRTGNATNNLRPSARHLRRVIAEMAEEAEDSSC